MANLLGFIDRIKDGVLSGWVVADSATNVSVYCDDILVGNLKEFHSRQDVVNAGFATSDCGFKYDLNLYLVDKSGDFKFSLKEGDKTLTTKSLYVPKGRCIIKNPFLKLENTFDLADIKARVSHRLGVQIERFHSQLKLLPATNAYTRIFFGDITNSRQTFELEFDLDSSKDDISNSCSLRLRLIARASVDTNVHIRFIDKDDQCLLDEPLLAGVEWESREVIVPEVISEKVRQGEIKITLRTKHHGRRFIDIGMLCLSDDVDKFLLGTASCNDKKSEINDASPQNILKNGELTAWNQGINFTNLSRGQELADNWFVEMGRNNKANIFAFVAANENKLPPYSQEFGLKIKTDQLDDYARLVCPFTVAQLNVVDYILEIDVAGKSKVEKLLLPRVFFIARSLTQDKQVAVVARKLVSMGRQKYTFELPAKDIASMISNASPLPVIVLAIDLPANNEFTVFSASLTEKPSVTYTQPINDSARFVPTEITELKFEDASISQQLHLLKGFENWSGIEELTISDEVTSNYDEDFTTSLGKYKSHILGLRPHKMMRPSRSYPFIDIIVPVYNACDDVLLCMSALVEKTDLMHRVIVINDGEDVATAEMLDAFQTSFNHIEVITNPQNLGYTRSVNKGIAHTNADWVVVLNSDTIVSEGWLGLLMNCALSDPDIGMVGALSNAASWQSVPEIKDASGDWHLNPLPSSVSIDQFAALVSKHSTRSYPNVGVINGFCQLISMTLLDDIGLLDAEAFPIGYGEENDMCARAVKAGYKLVIADDTYVYHSKSKSFGHAKRKELAKLGSAALKKKHPDVDWNEITKVIREDVALNELRKQLSLEIELIENRI